MILEILKAAITGATSPDEAVKNIQKSLGGCEIYIPVRDISTRNRQISDMFNGRNHAEVCRKYSISLRTLYRVIN